MKALINTCTVSWLRQTGTWGILSMSIKEAQSAFKSFYSYSTCAHTPNFSPLGPQLQEAPMCSVGARKVKDHLKGQPRVFSQ